MIYILYIVWNNSDIKLVCDKNLCQSSSDCKKLIIKYMYSSKSASHQNLTQLFCIQIKLSNINLLTLL